jgi:RNA-binding protein
MYPNDFCNTLSSAAGRAGESRLAWRKKASFLLTNKQRNFLRTLGNELDPIIIVGKGGVTAQVAQELKLALTARELVKGRALPHTGLETRAVARELATRTGAEIVQTVGRNILFYRPPVNGPSRLGWPEED